MLSSQCAGCTAPMTLALMDAVPEPCGAHCRHPARPHHTVRRLYFMGRCARCGAVQEETFRV